jgi:UDP:flavonoid glycosyltransferase YjiC (YdhE family)
VPAGIVDALLPLAGTVVATTGSLSPGAVPSRRNVRAARYVPLSQILPHTDLVVSHGGASTSVACLIAGVPQLVAPQGAPSQARVATAVAAAGVGASIAEGPLEPGVVTAAAAELLADPDIGRRIAAARATLDALPRPEEVVNLVVAAATGRS